MSQYTPGPWLFEDNRDGTFSVWTRQPHIGTLVTVHDEDMNGAYPVEANAKLIAAAPDLFEALSEFLELYETDEGCIELPQYCAATAAIAKARGDQ